MAFTDRPSMEKVLIGVLLAVVIGWGIRFFFAGGVVEYFEPDKRLENAIAEVLADEPGGEVLLRRLESDFPRKHDEFLDLMTRQVKRDQDDSRLWATANSWLNQFFASHENDFSYAPMPQLDAFIALEKEMLGLLAAEGVEGCDAMVVGLPPEGELSDELRAIGAKAMEARFDAIRAGRQDQQLRLFLSPTDFEAVTASLIEKGASEEQLEFLSGDLNGSVMEPGAPCAAAQMLIDTIIDQPEERRALLIGAYAAQG